MSINYGLVGWSIIPYILPLDSSLMMMTAAKQNDPVWIDQQSRIPFYNKFQALAEVFLDEINLAVIFCSSAPTAGGSIYLYKSKSSPILSTRKKRISPRGFLLFDMSLPGAPGNPSRM